MNHTLTLSESTYAWLQDEARKRGLNTIEELLALWQSEGDTLRKRRAVVQQIEALRQQFYAKYGEMPDSTPLVREDRER